MDSLNSIIIEGHVVRDPELKETVRGKVLCRVSVAVNRWYKTGDSVQQEVSYFDVEAWGNLAQSCVESAQKGRGVRIVGRLKQERWQGSDGRNRSKVIIVAEHIEFRPRFTQPDQKNAEGIQNSATEHHELSMVARAALAEQEMQTSVNF